MLRSVFCRKGGRPDAGLGGPSRGWGDLRAARGPTGQATTAGRCRRAQGREGQGAGHRGRREVLLPNSGRQRRVDPGGGGAAPRLSRGAGRRTPKHTNRSKQELRRRPGAGGASRARISAGELEGGAEAGPAGSGPGSARGGPRGTNERGPWPGRDLPWRPGRAALARGERGQVQPSRGPGHLGAPGGTRGHLGALRPGVSLCPPLRGSAAAWRAGGPSWSL